MVKKNIVWFEEVGKADVGLVGGKGANLGEMINSHFPVPYGFIITSNAYFSFIKQSNIQKKINSLLAIINYDNPHELQQVSRHIQELIDKEEISQKLVTEIVDYYENLVLKEEKKFMKKLKGIYKDPLVAVRSSATAEDLPNASFAGQQETYLNVKGEAVLLKKVKECWASLFTERAIYYRHQQGFDHFKVGLAAVVQRMVESEKSGVAFSVDPVTNDKTKIVIEAIFGLGEYIVQGKVTPDHYEVDKNSFVILEREIKAQKVKYVKSGISNKEAKVPKEDISVQKISDEEILKLAILVKEIEAHYFFPQDIEWAIKEDKVFIVQSRPITTLQNQKSEPIGNFTPLSLPIVVGAPASPGIGVGPVKIIHSPSEISKIKKGDVLVAPQTNPDYVPAMKKAVAIVTEKGGRTSHAAIVSRELGIPAVVGAEKATKILKNEMVISVNGATGDVFKGNVLTNSKMQISNIKQIQNSKKQNLKTLTKVYVNLAEPEQAEKVAKMDVDGVGLLRAEFMIAEMGIHPKEFIREKKESLFIRKLSRNILKFAEAFNPRPVIYRATDFKTNEYRHLVGGKKYEPEEENPMLGFRGASRYLANPDIFGLELRAINEVWSQGYRNIHLMIPFVRRPWEIIKIKQIINDYGLFSLPGFKLYMMVEVPSSALELEEFIKIGIDGVSIGTNDLTMMVLGVDRDNAEVAHIYDERSPAVLNLLEYIVATCVENNIPCSICGQAASDYPDLVEKLIVRGITSVSVNPDAVDRTRELIYEIEKKHYKNKISKKHG